MEKIKGEDSLARLFRFLLRWGHILLSGFVIYNVFHPTSPLLERAIFLCGLFALSFLHRTNSLETLMGKGINAVFLLISLVVFGYVIIYFVDIETRSGLVYNWEIGLGILAVLIILVATRSIVSSALTILTVVLLAYAVFGRYLPRLLGGYAGFDIERMTTYLYLSLNGIFGIVIYVMLKYVFLFVMFGKIMETSRAMDFIFNLSQRLVGRFTGGPAMVSVVSSGLMGTVSGSAVANVMVTGSITIPLMKKVGFEPHMAGAVEAAASTGGQFMPPAMGASAFLIMQFLGISYIEVCRAAAIPAVLYFIGILASVYFYSSRSGLGGLSTASLPKLVTALYSQEAVVFFVSVASLVFLLIKGLSPTRSVLYAMALGILFTWISPKKGLRLKHILNILEETSKSFMFIGIAGGCVGVIIAVLLMTGLATRFSTILIELSNGNLLIVLLLTLIGSILLGMGLPTAVAYIVLVMTSVPALTELGVIPIAAHLFIFYTGIMAMITPPVALAAYGAATLANANFWRTGIWASIIAFPAHLIAFAFVYDSALLMMGSFFHIIRVILTAGIGVCFFSFAIVGSTKSRIKNAGRFLVFLGAPLLVHPYFFTDILGTLIVLLGLFIYSEFHILKFSHKRQKKQNSVEI